MKALGIVGLLSCTMSGVITIAAPKTATVLDGIAWIILGVYIFAVTWVRQ